MSLHRKLVQYLLAISILIFCACNENKSDDDDKKKSHDQNHSSGQTQGTTVATNNNSTNNGGMDSGGGTRRTSTPNEVNKAIDLAIQLASEPVSRKNIVVQFWLNSARTSSNSRLALPKRQGFCSTINIRRS